MDITTLVERIRSYQGEIEGVTISGGEPFQQARPLLDLLQKIRAQTQLSLLLFSGYRRSEIDQIRFAGEALNYIDILIAGRYEQENRIARGLIGSSNKQVIFLTQRYSMKDLEQTPTSEVLINSDGEVQLTGIDPIQWQTTNQSPEELKILEELLSSAAPHLLHIPSDLADDLLRKGAVLALRENAGPTAVGTLAKLAATSPSVDTRNSALSALSLLAASGVVSAVDEMYNLGLEDHQAAARQMVSTAKWKPSNPGIKTLFDWLTAVDNQQDPAVNLEMLTEGFFGAAGPSLQARILSRAAATRLRNWAQMVALLIRAPQDLQGLVDLYPDLSQSEQSICLDRLDKLAAHETAAQVVLCRLFLEHDDRTARDIATAKGYRPTQPFEQALFYFLIGDQQRYQQVDFDHNLLVTAYEAGSRALRRRLLSFSRQTGQIEWLSAIHQTTEVRWLADLSDQDWDLAIHSLLEQSRFADLWRLAQVAPPVWSAGILVRLKRAQWKPDNERDRDGFHQLVNLAETCLQETLGLKPFLKLMSLSDEVLSLAIHPTGSLIAAGSSAQPILLWQLPGGDLRLPSLIGPASSTRAIQFSLDGELVIAASGDQRVRLFRHQNNQIIKTLEGHHGLIRAIALHPNGRMLITTSFDGAIRLWRFPLGTLIKTVFSPVREIFSAVTLSKGDLLATGGAGDQVNSLEFTGLQPLKIHTGGREWYSPPGRDRLIRSAGRCRSQPRHHHLECDQRKSGSPAPTPG